MRRRLLHWLLPFLMLLAQQGAAWHAMSHLHPTPPGAAGAQDPVQSRKAPTSDRACDQCLAFAGVADLLSTPVPLLALLQFSHGAVPEPALHAATLDAPVARSRGPPARG